MSRHIKEWKRNTEVITEYDEDIIEACRSKNRAISLFT